MSVPNAVAKAKLARYKPGALPAVQVSTGGPTVSTNPGSPNPTLVPYTSSSLRLLGCGNLTAGGGSNGQGNTDVSLTGYAIPEGTYDDKTMTPTVNRPPHTCVVDQLIEGEHDGQIIDIPMVNPGTTMMRVWWNNMDGVIGWQTEADSVWAARASLNVSTPATVRIDFGTRASRQIRIELTGCYIKGVLIEATAAWRPPSWPAGPHIIVVGDSISYGTFSDPSGLFSSGVKMLTIGGWIREMAARLGWHDIVNKSSGGTGYLATGGPQNAIQQISVFGTPTQGVGTLTLYDSAGAGHTATLNYNTTPSQLQTICDTVYGAGNSLVGGAGSFPGAMTITMQGAYAATSIKMPQLQTTTAFTGGSVGVSLPFPGGQQYAFTDAGRLADALQSADANSIIIWAGGYNDQSESFTASQIAAAMTTCLQAGAATGALQIVFGCFSSTAFTTQTTLTTLNQTLKTAALAQGALFFDPTDPLAPWYTPYNAVPGNVQAPNGAGNSDLYFGAPTPHPTRAGHQHYGANGAAAIVRQFAAIL